MEKISDDVQKIVNSKEDFYKMSNDFENLEKANEIFNALVKKGIISPRGYNIMSIEDRVTCTCEFNTDKSNIQNVI